ncbi:MAG: DUF3089 domain-containing protein [Bacteroidota bacterium]|nr:DUF3089 domain-containing protein [Bacteroidota bacterium]MDP4244942.1 DUF3089 domain-containing protein [Bacteroidota bacterium]MDP4256323.1 DUF3089 domain-containing protein [Bacteroidota bacterium]MDP4258460.1 DUF3089 domain-containing protein [Bacteroidota bacterium]
MDAVLFLSFSSLFFSSVPACSPSIYRAVSAFNPAEDTASPDYSLLENWAAHPDKQDPSDSIPEPLQATSITDTAVDVFFLHPTTLTSASSPEWNADIHDAALNARTDASTIRFQASVFNECRVFAPRYRQAHLRAYFTNDSASSRRAFDVAYGDLRAAFQYYLDHYNHGRPIIIASHSQGTTHAKRLLKEFFENQPLRGRLVAAYVIGMPIATTWFSELPACRDSAATGCIIDWRTFKYGYVPPYVTAEKSLSIVVNPLTWTTTDEYAPRSLNKGGILTHFSKLVPGVADAEIHGGILWTHRPHFPGSIFFRTKTYHIGDINLYYLNIRENIRTRVRSFEASAPAASAHPPS